MIGYLKITCSCQFWMIEKKLWVFLFAENSAEQKMVSGLLRIHPFWNVCLDCVFPYSPSLFWDLWFQENVKGRHHDSYLPFMCVYHLVQCQDLIVLQPSFSKGNIKIFYFGTRHRLGTRSPVCSTPGYYNQYCNPSFCMRFVYVWIIW